MGEQSPSCFTLVWDKLEKKIIRGANDWIMNHFQKMTYVEFKNWCNQRACDGQWSMIEAMTCISMMSEVDSVHVKGWFKKKANEIAKESVWRKLITREKDKE